jgi:ParB-like chromosome segregation protein Spo0J
MAVRKDPRQLETAEPFLSLFPVDPTTLGLVTGSMREHGFDSTKPLLAWRDAFGDRGRTVCIDGHTRLKAALDLKLPEVWVTVRQFKDMDAAITAGIGEQVQRRNLNREQIAAYVISILPMLDEVKGGLRTRTAKQLAAMLGVSVPTVDRARGVIASGDVELIEQVKAGELSLLSAYQQVTGNEPPPPATPADAVLRGLDLLRAREQELREAGIIVDEQTEPASSSLDEAVAWAKDQLGNASPEQLARLDEERRGEEEAEQRLEEEEQRLAGQRAAEASLTHIRHLLAEHANTVDELRYELVGATVKVRGHKDECLVDGLSFCHDVGLELRSGETIPVEDLTEVVKLPAEGS